MNKIRVLIVDDEPLARRGVRRLIEPHSDFVVTGEATNGYEAAEAIETLRPELVFLDIQMPDLDGISLVEQIGSGFAPEIVFVTAYDEHAITAFEMGAVDYVLKPINPERFDKTLERVRRRISSGESGGLEKKLSSLINDLIPSQGSYLERIPIRKDERIRFLNVEEIFWISSHGNYVEIHTQHGDHLVRETMDRFETKLNPQSFLRIRRSVIVRVEQIKELQTLFGGEYAVILKSGGEFASTRHYRKNV